MSTSERNKKRKRSEVHDRLQNFITALRKTCKILLTEKRNIEIKLRPLEIGLNKIFHEYDVDNSGFLDVVEIEKMLNDNSNLNQNDTQDHSNDAQEILNALDNDGNGYVEQSEFIKWVLSGLTRPKRSREIFASYSTFHQRYVEYFPSFYFYFEHFSHISFYLLY
jgi:Ca2+-binding EF-hand superfamily protein